MVRSSGLNIFAFHWGWVSAFDIESSRVDMKIQLGATAVGSSKLVM